MANETVNRYLNIYIQSGEAQKALDTLTAKEKKLNEEIAKAPANAKKLKEELAALQEPLDRARKKVSGELQPSLKDTENSARRLRNELKLMSETDAGFADKVEQLHQANAEMEAYRKKIGLVREAQKSMADEAKATAAGVLLADAVKKSLDFAKDQALKIVETTAKVSDELSDIRKTTGLQREEVRQLNNELKKIDTRTSREELRQLASEAGKLGIEGVDGIKKFVEQADKIKVALGEDLGESALTDIAKTSQIFKVDMLNMASAINEVGASSVASESYSVDFLKRMAGVAPTVRLSAQEVLGYSAALEGAGQTQEVAATALNTFMLDFVKASDEFGKAAGFTKGELAKMINDKGTNETFLTWLKRLKELNPEADKFLQKLTDVGVDAARGSNVLLALANNLGIVRTQQEIANGAIQSNASIMDEFNEKNTNAAAALEKFKNTLSEAYESELAMALGEMLINTATKLLSILLNLPKTIRENIYAFVWLSSVLIALNANKIKLIASILSKRAATLLETAATKLSAAQEAFAAMHTAIYAARKEYLAGRITLATAAQRIWNAVIVANPVGAFIVAITALIGVMAFFSTKTKELTQVQNLFNAALENNVEINNAVSKSVQGTQSKVQDLMEVIKSSITTDEQKKKALEQLIAISPDFLSGLTLQNVKHQEGINIINNYIAALGRMAEAQAMANLRTKLMEEKLERQNKIEGLVVEKPKVEKVTGAKRFFYGDDGKFFGMGDRNSVDVDNDIKAEQESINSIDRRLLALDNQRNTKVKGLQQRIINTKAQLAAAKKDSAVAKRLAAEIAKDEAAVNVLMGLVVDGTAPTTTNLVGGGGVDPKGGRKGKAAEDALKKRIAIIKELDNVLEKYQLKAENDPFAREALQLANDFNQLREKYQNEKDILLKIERNYQEAIRAIVKKYKDQEWQEQEDRQQKLRELLRKTDQADKFPKEMGSAVLQTINSGVQSIKADQSAAYELKLFKSKGKERLKLLNDQLENERLAALGNEKLTQDQKELLDLQFREKQEQNTMDFWASTISKYADFAASALNVYSQFAQLQTDKENAEIEADRRRNDKKQENLKKRLDAGLISQQDYDRQVSKMNADQDKRERDLKVKQFRREQRAKVVQTLISGAQGAASMLSAGPPVGWVMFGAALAAAAVQAAFIAKQKPPEYGRGGKLKGPSHADNKGMPVVDPRTNTPQAYLEGNEGIINKRTMGDRNMYTVTGTPSQIASSLNSWHGGVHWESGATMRPVWRMPKPSAMNYNGIRQAYQQKAMYASGGLYNSTSTATGTVNTQQSNDQMATLFMQMQANNQMLADTIAGLQRNGLKAYTILSDQQAQQKRMDDIEAEATMK